MNFLNILFFGILAGAATLIGVFLMVKKAQWAQKNLIYLLSFSAGVLLSFSLVHLLPEAVELNKNSFLIVFLSFVVFYILEHLLTLHSCKKDEKCETHETLTLVSWVGLFIHSIVDGIVIGVGFEVSFTLGLLSTLAVLLHELPEGVSSVAVMFYGGYTIKKAIYFSSLVALATPMGAILSFFLIKKVDGSLVGSLLALAAGSFLYVAASDLIPEIHRKSKILNIFLTLLGSLVPFIVNIFLP